MTNWRAWRGPLAPIAIALVAAAGFLGAGLFDADTEPRSTFVDAGPGQEAAAPAAPAVDPSDPATVTPGGKPARAGVAPAGAAPAATRTPGAAATGVVSPPPTMPDLTETTTRAPVKAKPPGIPPAPPTLAPHVPLVVKPVDDQGHPLKPTIFGVTIGAECAQHDNFAMSAGPDTVAVVCSQGIGDDAYLWRPV